MSNNPLRVTAREILGLTIWGEARGETILGQAAVGSVIRNRFLTDRKRYKSYHDVCLAPYQFSCWNLKDPNRQLLDGLAEQLVKVDERIKSASLVQCLYIARGIFEDQILDCTHGAKFYMENGLYNNKRPSWADHPIVVNVIGNHTFFQL